MPFHYSVLHRFTKSIDTARICLFADAVNEPDGNFKCLKRAKHFSVTTAFERHTVPDASSFLPIILIDKLTKKEKSTGRKKKNTGLKVLGDRYKH